MLCSIPPSPELQGRPERSWDLPQHESLEPVSQTPSIPKAEQVPAGSPVRGNCPHVCSEPHGTPAHGLASGNTHVDRSWSTADIWYLVCLGVYRKQSCYCRISAVGYSSCKQTFLANISTSSLELESFLRASQEHVHPAAWTQPTQWAGSGGADVVVLLWLGIS